MGVDIFHAEGGPGQQEITIRHEEPVRAADNHLMYRETVRNIAWKHGYYASFAPKVAPDHFGNKAHLHFSAWDVNNTRNLFYKSDDPYALSEVAYHFLGGVLEHMPGLLAMTAPSVNSYRRLGARSWSCAYIAYGPDNREAAVRVPSALWGKEQESVNFELKASDSSANPYIALGGVLAAGMDGVRRKLMPPEGLRVDVDPSTLSQREREARGICPLPENLAEATDALERDGVLMEAMGPTLAASYLTVRRGEAELFSEHDAEFEFEQHFYRY
jgi:glutamine synthetase